jgi:hypothetical protein
MISSNNSSYQPWYLKLTKKFQTFFSFPRWFAPIIDGIVLPESPENILKSGKISFRNDVTEKGVGVLLNLKQYDQRG